MHAAADTVPSVRLGLRNLRCPSPPPASPRRLSVTRRRGQQLHVAGKQGVAGRDAATVRLQVKQGVVSDNGSCNGRQWKQAPAKLKPIVNACSTLEKAYHTESSKEIEPLPGRLYRLPRRATGSLKRSGDASVPESFCWQ